MIQDGDLDTYYYVDYSHGRIYFRRTRLVPLAFIILALLVMFLVVIAMSAFPTGVRSPSTSYSYNAWYVTPSGDVDNPSLDYVSNSYGKDEAALMHQILIKCWLRSPSTAGSVFACYVSSSGNVDDYYNSNGVRLSFGRISSNRIHSCITIIRLSM